MQVEKSKKKKKNWWWVFKEALVKGNDSYWKCLPFSKVKNISQKKLKVILKDMKIKKKNKNKCIFQEMNKHWQNQKNEIEICYLTA